MRPAFHGMTERRWPEGDFRGHEEAVGGVPCGAASVRTTHMEESGQKERQEDRPEKGRSEESRSEESDCEEDGHHSYTGSSGKGSLDGFGAHKEQRE